MTERLYWYDPYRRTFSARVIEALEYEGRPAAVLEATCFYPTSGGQPHDTGLLGDAAVEEALEVDDRVLHLLSAPVEPGTYSAAIDWARRFDHMQQHTGQHLLSRAFARLLGAETTSFHLGAEASTIDLDIEALRPEQAEAVEEEANRVVYEDRSVVATLGTTDAPGGPGVRRRRAPKGEGPLRLVTVEDYDASACGGTHVARTGEVGSVHLRRWERQRGGVRVEFLCGARALRAHRALARQAQALAQELSVGVAELPDAVARLVDAEQAARRQAEALRKRLLAHVCQTLAQEAERLGEVRLVCRLLEGHGTEDLGPIAQNLVEGGGTVALLAVSEPAPQFCFARSPEVPVDAGALLREALQAHGGRGGGRPHHAQGGGVAPAEISAVLGTARQRLQAML